MLVMYVCMYALHTGAKAIQEGVAKLTNAQLAEIMTSGQGEGKRIAY